MRQKIFLHADAGVCDGESEHGFTLILCLPFDLERYLSTRRREFDSIAENVDQDLPELHVVSDVVIVNLAMNVALIIKPLVLALPAEHGVDGFQQFREGKFLISQRHPAGLDAGHVQNIIDQVQQMPGGGIDLFQVFPCFRRSFRIVQCNVVQPDDGVHRSADLMAHAGKESGFRPVRLLRCSKCIGKCLALCHGFPCISVNVHKTGSHTVHDMVVPVLRMTDTCKPDGLIGFSPVPLYHIGIGYYAAFLQPCPDGIRLDKAQKFFTVRLCDILVGIGCNREHIGESLPHLEASPVEICMGLITDSFTLVQLKIIDAPVI